MENRISFIVQVTVFILLGFEFDGVANQGQPDFNQLRVVWPASVCSTSKMQQRHRCQLPLKEHFIIHALKAMYKPDTPVKAYDNGGCNPKVEPSKKESITSELLSQSHDILEDMKENWGSFRDYTNTDEKSANIKFWRGQWMANGICFGDPDNPKHYFSTGLFAAESLIGDGRFNFLNALAKADIKPNQTKYSEMAIAKAIFDVIKVVPQINCNRNSHGIRQFKGINVCYQRTPTGTSVMADCSVPFTEGCLLQEEGVLFPTPIIYS